MPEKSSKGKWEKDRRNRLNEALERLSKVLPSYDPSTKFSKIVIIENALSTIQDLDEKLKKFLSSNNEKEDAKCDIIRKFEVKVKKLYLRNEQLCNLLKDAGIKIPAGYGAVVKRKAPKWSNKITSNQAKVIQKRKLEKENIASPHKDKTAKRQRVKCNDSPSHRKTPVDSAKIKKTTIRRKKKATEVPNGKCLIFLSQAVPVSNPCYIVAKNFVKRSTETAVTNSALLKAPLVTSIVKPSIFSGNLLPPTFGTGTLVLANGSIIQTSPSVPTQTILTNPIQNNLSTVFIVSNSSRTVPANKVILSQASTDLSQNIIYKTVSLPKLRPKPCFTRTTQVIKLPIPAVITRYNKYPCLKNNTPKKKQPLKKAKGIKEKSKIKRSRKAQIKRKQPQSEMCDVKKTENNVTADNNNDNNDSVIEKTQHQSNTVEKDSLVTEDVIEQKTENKTDDNKDKMLIDKSTVSLAAGSETPTVQPQQDIQNSESEHNEDLQNTAAISENLQEISSQAEVNLECQPSKEQQPPPPPPGISVSVAETEAQPHECHQTSSETPQIKNLDLTLGHSELSNDIFASLQVPPGCQNPQSTSPTAAFLLAFPLVSSGVKVTEVIDGDNNSDSQRETPNLLQIGTLENTKTTQANPENLTPSLLNLDNFSFFTTKDMCGSYYTGFNSNAAHVHDAACAATSSEKKNSSCEDLVQNAKILSEKTEVAFNKPKESIKEQNILADFGAAQIAPTPTVSKCNSVPNISQKGCSKYHSKPEQRSYDATQTNMNFNNNTNILPVTNSSTTQDLPIHYKQPPSKETNHNNFRNENGAMNPNMTKHFNDFALPNLDRTSNKNKTSHAHIADQNELYTNKSYDCSTNYTNQKLHCSYNSANFAETNKNFNTFYPNSNSYSYNYQPESSFGSNHFKSISGNEGKNNYFLNYSSTDYQSNNNYCSNVQPYKDKYMNNQAKLKAAPESSKPINWMTTPDNNTECKSDYLLPQFTKQNETSHNVYNASFGTTVSHSTYFSTAPMYSREQVSNTFSEGKKSFDLTLKQFNSYQKSEAEDNQFSWSPSKIPQFLDPSHSFVPSTLPTLVGDLALNTHSQYSDQKNAKERKDNMRKLGNYTSSQVNQTNFLSVSQLVDHNKETIPPKTATRRNSNARPKITAQKVKRLGNKQENKDYHKIDKQRNPNNNFNMTDMFCDQKQQIKEVNKNVPSNYSAEALISQEAQTDVTSKKLTKPIVPSFLTESIISYFPSGESSQIPQEGGYIQSNQTYQSNTFSHNFTNSFQNNTFTTNNFIPSSSTLTTTYLQNPTYMQAPSFMQDSNNHDFYSDSLNVFQNNTTKDRAFKDCNKQPQRLDKMSNNNCRKTKKRNSNDNIPPSFDIPFLSMPGSINSPILPDDFHHSTFLPSATPFSCKNTLYPKQNPDLSTNNLLPPLPPVPGNKPGVQHPDVSPSVNTAGTSLTNFNLSTIFPEINKAPISNFYPETRTKEPSVSRNFPLPPSVPTTLSSKSSFTFGGYT